MSPTLERLHERLYAIRTVLPTDYAWHGGGVERWSNPDVDYPDCGTGCAYAIPVQGKLGSDWVVCGNEKGPRYGLLTFEHQAGFGCFAIARAVTQEASTRSEGADR